MFSLWATWGRKNSQVTPLCHLHARELLKPTWGYRTSKGASTNGRDCFYFRFQWMRAVWGWLGYSRPQGARWLADSNRLSQINWPCLLNRALGPLYGSRDFNSLLCKPPVEHHLHGAWLSILQPSQAVSRIGTNKVENPLHYSEVGSQIYKEKRLEPREIRYWETKPNRSRQKMRDSSHIHNS